MTTIRIVFLSMLIALAEILAITAYIAGDMEKEADPLLWAGIITAAGLFDVVMIVWARGKVLGSDVDSMETAGATYATTFFLSYALAMSAALIGFVSVFITGELWPMLVGYAFALAGSFLFAPTRSRLANIERELQQRGIQGSFVAEVKPAIRPPWSTS